MARKLLIYRCGQAIKKRKRESEMCDQCQAMMIQGVLCHERGCPNARKPTRKRSTKQRERESDMGKYIVVGVNRLSKREQVVEDVYGEPVLFDTREDALAQIELFERAASRSPVHFEWVVKEGGIVG